VLTCVLSLLLTEDPDKEPGIIEKVLFGKGSNLALAILASKVCVPVKIPVAMAITPYVQRWQEHIFRGWALSKVR
jgi:hypothetical protein